MSRVSHVSVPWYLYDPGPGARAASCGPGPAAVLCRDVGGGGRVDCFQRYHPTSS